MTPRARCHVECAPEGRPGTRARRNIVPRALVLLVLAACSRATVTAPTPTPSPLVHAVVPVPQRVELSTAERFMVDSTTTVYVDGGSSSEVDWIGGYLARLIGGPSSTGPRHLVSPEQAGSRSIRLVLDGRANVHGPEGYELTIARDRATLVASEPAGLFHGVQSIRQLLPASVEHAAAQRRTLWMPTGRIIDAPRLVWRGAMLDVARHFLPAEDVKRFVDLMALYKLNRLHLHLSDDQGWRIEIAARANLTKHGGASEVGGGPGGYYTQAVYADLVAYAKQRYVTIVPEIDMPGHTNAALSSYAELNCDGVAPPRFTGTAVGFSALCVDREDVYHFIDDVVGEIAAMTSGPYFHIGGDEVERLTPAQYRRFVERVEGIVRKHGKVAIGWADIAPANLSPTTIVQHWSKDSMALHVARGGKVILSPASKVYLDMKYDSATVLGLSWAGRVEVRDAYALDPGSFQGLPESAVLGVEAPLWSETVMKLADAEYLAFPRLAAVAEVGWSSAAARQWESFRLRLAAQGPRLAALGVNYYRSPQVPWLQ